MSLITGCYKRKSMKDEILDSLRILLWNTNLLAGKNPLGGRLGISKFLFLLLLYSQYICGAGGARNQACQRKGEKKRAGEKKKIKKTPNQKHFRSTCPIPKVIPKQQNI